MNIASMTGFARVQGSFQTPAQTIGWVWEAKSVNNKNLDLKFRLPYGFEEQSLLYKTKAAIFLSRGSISVSLDLDYGPFAKKVKIDEALLSALAQKAIDLTQEFSGKLAPSSAAELLAQRGVVDFEENPLSDDEKQAFEAVLLEGFEQLCQALQNNRRIEGTKIAAALRSILQKISDCVSEIEKISADLPQKLREKLASQLKELAKDVSVSEDRLAQEVVFLVTRADIREEIDRLKTHLSNAKALIDSGDVVGRRLDFLCQELNREANTTCSKALDIALTNLGMDLKALIEQFREQVQNIE